MTSADFLAHRKRIYSKTSPGKSNFLRSITGTSTTKRTSSLMSQRSIVEFGRHVAVDTHPLLVASYVLSVRQYRTLQSPPCSNVWSSKAVLFLLHCMGHSKPRHFFMRKKYDLLHFGSLLPCDRTLTCWKIYLNTPFDLPNKICTFEFLLELHKECAHAHAGHTHGFGKSGGSVLRMTILW